MHTKLNCVSDEGGERGRITRQARIPGISSESFEESPSQLCYSGKLFEKRKVLPGGRQSYAVT